MESTPELEPHKGSVSSSGHLRKAASTGGDLAWLLYRTALAGGVAEIVPTHTRDAVSQLYRDVKSNVPKDTAFFHRHAKAFKPETALGWLALSGALGYCISAILILSTITLGISVAGLSVALFAILTAGAMLATALGFLGIVLFTSAFVLGCLAFTAVSGYALATGSVASMRYISHLFFGDGGKAAAALSPASLQATPLAPAAPKWANASNLSVTGDSKNSAHGTSSALDDTTTATNVGFRASTYASPRAVLPPIKTTPRESASKRGSPVTREDEGPKNVDAGAVGGNGLGGS